MSHYSCFYRNFQTLSRLIAHCGAVVVMVDFRNSETAALRGETTAPFPAGLHDCVSAIRWAHAHLGMLGASHVIVAGESGGGNLAIAATLSLLRAGERPVRAVYILCPMLRGRWGGAEASERSSWIANAGIFMDYPEGTPIVKGYGFATPEENRALHETRNALAWPGLYCDQAELAALGFPPCAVVVNEFDPLRDDGVGFHELCEAAGLRGCSLQSLPGAIHGVGSYLPNLAPEVTRDQCRRMVAFAREHGALSTS